MRSIQLLSGWLALAGPVLAQHAAGEHGWRFELRPQLLLTNIEGEASLGNGLTPFDIDLQDVLDDPKLSGALRGAVRHEHSGWGLILGYEHVEIGDRRRGSYGFIEATGLRQEMFEAFVSHRTTLSTGAELDVFGGARRWDLDVNAMLSSFFTTGPTVFNRRVDWIDPVLGCRIESRLDAAWSLLAHAECGGFGLGADFSWAMSVGLRARLHEAVSIELSYRVLGVDYDEGAASSGDTGFFRYDTVTHGPMLGMAVFF